MVGWFVLLDCLFDLLLDSNSQPDNQSASYLVSMLRVISFLSQSDPFHALIIRLNSYCRICSHSDTTRSVGFRWTRVQPVAENSTCQHTTLTTDRYPCTLRDSNPQSQQTNGRRPTWQLFPRCQTSALKPLLLEESAESVKLRAVGVQLCLTIICPRMASVNVPDKHAHGMTAGLSYYQYKPLFALHFS